MKDDFTASSKYLTFNLGNESYGIEIRYVAEIIGMQAITEMPDSKEYVRGIINLRGKIIPLIDARLKFMKPFRQYGDRTCIIVLEIQGIVLGLVVDSVADVTAIPEENIIAPPDRKTGFSNKYINGIGKTGDSVKLLIDCEMLLDNEGAQTAGEIEETDNTLPDAGSSKKGE